MFNPKRLTFARKQKGMNMSQLAREVGVDLRSISAYEKGEFEPKDEKLNKLVEVLGFPLSFYYLEDVPEIATETVSFRAMTKMSATLRGVALASGSIALMLNTVIESKFSLPEVNFLDFSKDPQPEVAADSLRRHWNLGELPVKNMVHLLEANGTRVFSLAINAQEVDAFSFWREDSPFVFLNTQKSSERSRFDCAHELGHLLLHRHGDLRPGESQILEREADAFASAFLMPRNSVLGHAPKFVTLDSLMHLKKIWGVSVAAMCYRLHHLGVISDWQYRDLAIQIAKNGFRKQEPMSMQRESSQVLRKILSALKEVGISKQALADELHVSINQLDELMFGLTMTLLQGSGNGRSNEDFVGDLPKFTRIK